MDQLFKFITNLNAAQRAVVIGGFSVLFVFLIGLLVYSNIKAQDEKLNYTIATSLTKNQVMLASTELENAGIPFTIIGTGNNLTLRTNKEFINIAKIKLVTSEAATNKHTGWEIFEKSSLGTTNFENKVKYQRALEGELARSLESLSGVLAATVKIAFPKDTIFTQKQMPPSASAVLKLKPGVFLTQKQIEGIKNFIASAVPKLSSENIKIIDQDGSLLERTTDDIEAQKFSTQQTYKEDLEKNYEQKIINLIEPIVGIGRVVAKVTVDLDFTKRESQKEIYDPEGTIRSQQTTESSSANQGGANNAGGEAGVENNIETPGNGAGAGGGNSSAEEAKTITNYEITKEIVSQKDNGFASLRKISAAVTFDRAVLVEGENKDEYINNLINLVEGAVGFDPKRGDIVRVKDFIFPAFKTQVGEDGQPVPVENIPVDGGSLESPDTITQVKSLLKDLGEYIQYLIAAVLLFVFYKKFIASNEVVVLTDQGGSKNNTSNNSDDGYFSDYEHEFDVDSAHGRLKAKVKSQIMNNIEGLDEEDAAKYEVLIEHLDKEINDKPEQMAEMIEMLLSEGDMNFKSSRSKKAG